MPIFSPNEGPDFDTEREDPSVSVLIEALIEVDSVVDVEVDGHVSPNSDKPEFLYLICTESAYSDAGLATKLTVVE